MPINTKSPEVRESPIITGAYGGTPIEISQILDGGLDFLNRKLAGKTLEQQVQILKISGYVFEQKSGYGDIRHYIKNDEESGERQSISTVLRDELVSFGGDFFAEEISAAIQINPTILKGFYVKRNGRWYLYDIGEDYRVTGETFLSDVSVQNPEGFDSIDELDISLQNQKFEKALSQKRGEQLVRFLEENYFQAHQQSQEKGLVHFMRERKIGGQEVILYDVIHKKCIPLNGRYIASSIALEKDKDTKIFGIRSIIQGRYFFYTFGKQYNGTKIPQLVKNGHSPDGGFSSQEELDRFLQLMYRPVVGGRN